MGISAESSFASHHLLVDLVVCASWRSNLNWWGSSVLPLPEMETEGERTHLFLERGEGYKGHLSTPSIGHLQGQNSSLLHSDILKLNTTLSASLYLQTKVKSSISSLSPLRNQLRCKPSPIPVNLPVRSSKDVATMCTVYFREYDCGCLIEDGPVYCPLQGTPSHVTKTKSVRQPGYNCPDHGG